MFISQSVTDRRLRGLAISLAKYEGGIETELEVAVTIRSHPYRLLTGMCSVTTDVHVRVSED
jgi:hypothetical protein